MIITLRRQRGAALIIVLCIVTMLLALVLAFFSMVRTERQSSGSFTESVAVRSLTELPVSLAISQVRKATENLAPDENKKANTETQFRTWASQPGMIRVFGMQNIESGGYGAGYRSRPTALYKLYSDDVMVVTHPGAKANTNGLTVSQVNAALQSDQADLEDWNEKPGIFTDLNEPAPVPGAAPAYKFPILDPRAAVAATGGHAVDGFTCFTPGETSAPANAAKVAGTVKATNRTDLAARLPMPVRWVYVLKDGTLATPVSGDAERTTFSTGDGIPSPTAENPIVGRIAFWTDDDTCKININTASEGSHWDMPLGLSQTEKHYAERVPAQNEYNRFPGHPAATSLSTVFQAFGNEFYVHPAAPVNAAVHERLIGFSPCVPWGGTQAGTKALNPSQKQGLPRKQERLYAGVDELFFNRERDRNSTALDVSALELGRFFLTAHSRAPEMSLFGKPRISLWPQSEDESERNPKDKLLAFLSETRGRESRKWYWERHGNFASEDSPGTSQTLSGDYSGTSGDPRYRNHNLVISYFNAVTNQGIPGFGSATFLGKWGTGKRDPIGVQIFDLLRWGVNGHSAVSVDGWPTYSYLPPHGGVNARGQSSALPLRISTLVRGFGRWPTITEAALVFIHTEEPQGESGGAMQAYLLLEPFIPVNGPPFTVPSIIYRIQGLGGFTIKYDNDAAGEAPHDMGFANKADNLCREVGQMPAGNTPFNGFGSTLHGKTAAAGSQGGEAHLYPFVSQSIAIKKGAQEFTFSGGSVTIRTFPWWNDDNPPDDQAVQTIAMDFPQVTLRLPRTARAGGSDSAYATVDSRLAAVDPHGHGLTHRDRLVMDGDIVRSVEPNLNAPARGDLRFYSALQNVPASWFMVHPQYHDKDTERLQFLRVDDHTHEGQFGPHDPALATGGNPWPAQHGRQSTHSTAGTLIEGFTYVKGAAPAVPRGLNGARLKTTTADTPNYPLTYRPGDWDNGVGPIADGPYLRKPDEGNAMGGGTAYLSRHHFEAETGASYSPNRQIASAIQFGSLLTGLDPGQLTDAASVPWRTLLFCPNPPSRSSLPDKEPGSDEHRGYTAPRDHLLLDWFWMPVVDPYAISEPFSTAGKINMNYELVPFTHIERSTGVRAVLKSARIAAIPPSAAGSAAGAQDLSAQGYEKTGTAAYKGSDASSTYSHELRYAVNADLTLEGFRQRFRHGDIFRSATEICGIFLVPQRLEGKTYPSDAAPPPASYGEMTKWWNGDLKDLTKVDAFELTGDNTREMPYNHLYPRLTTQSNTYTVHHRVQTLKKARSSPPGEWVEGVDTVAAEHRGSTTFERYLDPNEKQIAGDLYGVGFNVSWDRFYRIRMIHRKQFAP